MGWEAIIHWDQQAFLTVNNAWGNRLFDLWMPLFREKWFWAPFYLFLTSFAFIKIGWKNGARFTLGLLFTVALCDFTSSELIKKNVQRLRPCNEPQIKEQVILRASCGGGYSFTSSHATNHFGVALYVVGMLGFLSRWMRPCLLLWATAIALAQVYVGVHYPLDVGAGGILGAALGGMVARLFGSVRLALIAKA
jgi:undecaprenyl-diphosphatase